MSPRRPRVLGLVPARGGSKGIPRKNLRPLGGRPLLAWTAESALAATSLARTVLSTDDEEIAEAGRRLGLDVPFLRPAELARDETPTLPVVAHALAAVEGDDGRYDAVCLLQPTSPFRPPGLIDTCVERLATSDADAVVTVLPVPAEHHPAWVYFERDGHLELCLGGAAPVPRRQDLRPAFHRDGSVYVTRREAILRGSLYGDRVVGVAQPEGPSVNLDTEGDWERAEALCAVAVDAHR